MAGWPEGAWAKLVPPGMEEILSPDKIPARRVGEHQHGIALADNSVDLLIHVSRNIVAEEHDVRL